MQTRKSYSLNRSNLLVAGSLTGLRVVSQLVGAWKWNGDIATGIEPGLRCWYCQSWQAPYGILWHLVSYPLLPNFILLTSLVDGLVMVALNNRNIFLVYTFCSAWIWLQAPYDLPVLWLTLPGLIWFPLTILGPLAKLPFGAPSSVWNYVLSKNYSVNDLQYYCLMGLVMVAVWVSGLKKWLKRPQGLSS